MNTDKIERLQAYLREELSPSDASEIEESLSTDRELAEMLEVLKKLNRQAEVSRLEGLESAARKLASQLVGQFLENEATDGPLRGVPVFDSRLLPIPEGVRPATVDTCRVSYKIEDVEVVLSMYPISPERFEVIGQIVGWDDNELPALQLRTGRGRQSASCDEHGVFRFPEVTVGKHALAVRSRKKIIGIIHLDL